MDTPERIDDLISGKRDQGDFVSEGTFTIDGAKAWEKLGSFQLPFVGAWVLKLVQAAQAQEGASLVLSFRDDEIRFSFRDFAPLSAWSHSAFERDLFSSGPHTNIVVSHLVAGIRALAQQEKKNFSLLYRDGFGVHWDGKKFTDVESEPLTDSDFVIMLVPVPVKKTMFSSGSGSENLRFLFEEIKDKLEDYCFLHDGRIFIEDETFGGLATAPKFGPAGGFEWCEFTYTVAIFKSESVPELPTMLSNPADELVRDPLVTVEFTAFPVPTATQELSEFSVAACLSFYFRAKNPSGKEWNTKITPLSFIGAPPLKDRQGTSEILWVESGVVVAREELPIKEKVGVTIFVPAAGLEKDLSGLIPRDGEMKDKRLRRALQLIHPQLSEFAAAPPTELVGSGNRYFSRASLAAAVAGAGFMMVNPVMGGAVCAYGTISTIFPKFAFKRAQSMYQQEMKTVVEQLGKFIDEC